MSASCPLYPQKRTLVERVGMSALCQKRTFCTAAETGAIRSPRRRGRAKIGALTSRAPLRPEVQPNCWSPSRNARWRTSDRDFFSLSQWVLGVFADQRAIDCRGSRACDNNDMRSHIAQHAPRQRARANALELDYPQTVQRPFQLTCRSAYDFNSVSGHTRVGPLPSRMTRAAIV